MKLTLIRHGMTEGNARQLFYGATDLPLLPEGIARLKQQAAETPYPTAPHYYTSGLLRTEQTLTALYGDVPHTAIPDLREMDFGMFEMRPYEGDLEYDEDFRRWQNEQVETNVCPGGESVMQVGARALKAIAPIIARDEDAVCVIHGGTIAGLIEEWFPTGVLRHTRAPQPGCGYQILIENGTPVSYRPIPDSEP
ncbi:MAG: histidine phosphatase family protein [Clostridiales bacterium]|nr:histidine phosphatase family protein [Candidatus Cacconaster stercorequi]